MGSIASGYGPVNANSYQISAAGSYSINCHVSGTASGQGYAYFAYNASYLGSITQNGTTGVLYNITSDYRLKENITPISTGLSKVLALNPVTLDWTSDKSTDSGFIAHEFQAVIPHSVTGEKDAIDENGKPVYQGMDNSGVIPFLVAAIQELKAEVDSLNNNP